MCDGQHSLSMAIVVRREFLDKVVVVNLAVVVVVVDVIVVASAVVVCAASVVVVVVAVAVGIVDVVVVPAIDVVVVGIVVVVIRIMILLLCIESSASLLQPETLLSDLPSNGSLGVSRLHARRVYACRVQNVGLQNQRP